MLTQATVASLGHELAFSKPVSAQLFDHSSLMFLKCCIYDVDLSMSLFMMCVVLKWLRIEIYRSSFCVICSIVLHMKYREISSLEVLQPSLC